MSCCAQDILELAKSLDLNGGEVSCRNVASRAYYALFHCATNALPITQHDQRCASAHEKLIGEYHRASRGLGSGRTEARLIAEALGRLKAARVLADYRLSTNFSEVNAKKAIVDAEVAFAEVARYVEKLQAGPANPAEG